MNPMKIQISESVYNKLLSETKLFERDVDVERGVVVKEMFDEIYSKIATIANKIDKKTYDHFVSQGVFKELHANNGQPVAISFKFNMGGAPYFDLNSTDAPFTMILYSGLTFRGTKGYYDDNENVLGLYLNSQELGYDLFLDIPDHLKGVENVFTHEISHSLDDFKTGGKIWTDYKYGAPQPSMFIPNFASFEKSFRKNNPEGDVEQAYQKAVEKGKRKYQKTVERFNTDKKFREQWYYQYLYQHSEVNVRITQYTQEHYNALLHWVNIGEKYWAEHDVQEVYKGDKKQFLFDILPEMFKCNFNEFKEAVMPVILSPEGADDKIPEEVKKYVAGRLYTFYNKMLEKYDIQCTEDLSTGFTMHELLLSPNDLYMRLLDDLHNAANELQDIVTTKTWHDIQHELDIEKQQIQNFGGTTKGIYDVN